MTKSGFDLKGSDFRIHDLYHNGLLHSLSGSIDRKELGSPETQTPVLSGDCDIGTTYVSGRRGFEIAQLHIYHICKHFQTVPQVKWDAI